MSASPSAAKTCQRGRPGCGLTRHNTIETIPAWAILKFRRVCYRDHDSVACVVPVYEDGSDFAFGASISEGGIGFLSWLSDTGEAHYRAVFDLARSVCAAGLFMPLGGGPPEFPVGDGDAVVEVPVDGIMGVLGDTAVFRCVLFGVNSKDEAAPGTEPFLPLKLRIPVANAPHLSLRPHPACLAWQGDCEDESVDVDKDQKFITFHRDVRVEEFSRGTRVTLDQPVVFFAKRERMFEMSVVSAATFTRGATSLWEARHWGCASVDSADPLIVSYYDGRLFIAAIKYAVWILRGWYLDPYRPCCRGDDRSADDAFYWGGFQTPFVEVCAARRIQRFWRRLRCNPHHPVGNKLLRLEFKVQTTLHF
jgi:hypothetical protein